MAKVEPTLKTTRYFEEQVMRKRPCIDFKSAKVFWRTRSVAKRRRMANTPLGRCDEGWRNSTAFPPRDYVGGRRNDPQRILRPKFPRGRQRRLHYYPETDSLYIELKSSPGAETIEVVEGLNVDIDETGAVVGFDIDKASDKLDLSRIDTITLPLATAAE